jgi:hypothetical protein
MILSNSDDAAWWPVVSLIDGDGTEWPAVTIDYRTWSPL